MNYLSNVYTDKDAREKLMRGIDGVTDAVKLTLGASGGNAILQKPLYPGHLITNDGKSIAEDIVFTDPVENIGANLIKEITQKSERDSGDGTTTSAVLTQAILHEGMTSDASPMDIKRSLDDCLEIILKSIDKQTKAITPDEVGQVATISSESEYLGSLFQEIYQKIGKDGIVEIANSNTPVTLYDVTDGVRLRNCGFQYPYMANDEKGKTATYVNPKVLITKQKISTLFDIDKLFQSLNQKGINELVIFCDDIDPRVSEALAQMHMKGAFKTLIIKSPTLWKDWLYEDFAKITGATIIDPSQGVSFKTVGLHHLGSCENITTTKNETLVRGIKDISTHIQSLQDNDNDDSRLRLNWLQTKTAILKLGANSESELSYIRLKAEDARNASYLALQDGIVAGGGVALLNASKSLPDTIGGKILSLALKAPMSQILINSGIEKFNLDVKEDFGDKKGYDAKAGKITDMFKAGIVDPARVVKNSIRNAISVAGTVLTSRIVVTQPNKVVE